MKNYNLFKWTGVIVKTVFSVFLAFSSFSARAQIIDTSPQFVKGNDTLVAYTNVKGLDASEFYKIEVKSAATNDQWIDCYANITRSLWSTIPITGTGNKEHYYSYVKDWSHTYANIEMSRGRLVEVRISAKNGFKIKGLDFTKANVHPAHKASVPSVLNNIVYFTIDNPGQFTVDINGQMDETNTGNKYAGPAIHTVSLFANPVMVKPSLTDPNVQVVEPGVKPSSNLGSKTILYFKPGVHNIGRNFTIFANKSYYIPGDAVVYGTLTNDNGSGANIKIFGYGTLSGDKIKHSNYDPEYAGNDKSWKLIWSVNCSNFVVDGISLMNCPKHTMNLWTVGSTKKETFTRWTKIVTWRANGDGIGSCDEITDSFIRTQDDCCYVKGDRKRNVFWTDVNGTVFSMAGMDAATVKPIIIEDCDIIYPRHCSTTWNGGKVFAKRGDQDGNDQNKTTIVNVIFRDIRITDPFQTLETFYIASNDRQGSSGAYAGITFKNITSVKPPLPEDNRIIGHANGIWDDITFDNVVLGGKKILSKADFAAMEPFVTNVKFISGVSVTGVSISGCPTSAMNVNATNQLTAAVAPTNADNKAVTWSSSNTAAATVSSTGLVMAISAGSSTITATTVDGNKTAVCNITVSVSTIAVSGVTITGCSTAVMNVNETNQLAATVAPTDASNKSVNWSSSNTAIATVSSTGLVTARAAGSATITVTTVDGAKTAVCNLTVVQAVIGVTVAGCPITAMTVNATNQLTATVAPTDATNKSVNWSSSNTAVATVSSTGLVTAKATGSATITATTVDGNKTAVCSLTVASTPCVDQLDKIYAIRTINNQTITNEFFGAVNTSCSSMVTITADVVGQGGLDTTDYCKMTYKIDDGPQIVLFDIKNMAGSFSKRVFSITVAATSKVELILNAKNTAKDEKYIISNIKIVRASQATARVGIKEVENTNAAENRIRIYPNPATDILNIDFVEEQGTKEIKVFNANGQLIYSTQTTNGNATIDIKTLNLKGILIVKVVEGGSVYSNKVIIK